MLTELPNGWIWTKLEVLAEKINPGFPSGKHNKENRGIPHIRPMNISLKGEIDLAIVKYVETSNYEPLLKGYVLFNNTNSPEMLGKTTYLRQDTNWAYSNHMTRIRLFQQFLEPAWVAYYLHFLFLNGFFKMNCVHHVNQASINSGFLSKKIPIPLAPLTEQRRIVARIEELFRGPRPSSGATGRRSSRRRWRAGSRKSGEGRIRRSSLLRSCWRE
jgi:type I restriction enzyme S subunit